jgi:hypothetical protein
LRTLIIAMLIAALAAPAFIRTESVTVPPWRVRFVDLKGEALRGLEVEQTWRNYSVESGDEAAGNRATGATDGDGWVSFPERRLNTSLLARIIGPVRSVQHGGMHAAFGPQSALHASCRLMSVGWVEPVYSGGTLPESITLRYAGTPEEAKDVAPGDPCAPLIRQAIGGEPGPRERQP